MDLLDPLLEMGRPGGVILLLLAAGLIGFTVWDMQATGSFFVAAPGLAFAFGLLGLMLLVAGSPGAQVPIERPPMSDSLLLRLTEPSRPYFVCTHCRSVSGPPPCLACGKTSDVMEIRDDEDMRMALVAME